MMSLLFCFVFICANVYVRVHLCVDIANPHEAPVSHPPTAWKNLCTAYIYVYTCSLNISVYIYADTLTKRERLVPGLLFVPTWLAANLHAREESLDKIENRSCSAERKSSYGQLHTYIRIANPEARPNLLVARLRFNIPSRCRYNLG